MRTLEKINLTNGPKTFKKFTRKNNTRSREVIGQCSRFFVLFLSNWFNDLLPRLQFFEYKIFLLKSEVLD